jgi:hypothetical protein
MRLREEEETIRNSVLGATASGRRRDAAAFS